MFDCLCSGLPKDTRVLKISGKVETISLPTSIQEKDVLVKVSNVSLNIRDATNLNGSEDKAWASDFSGVVKRAGSDSGFKKGELVYGTINDGAFSEFLVVSNESITRTPPNISSEVACCLPFAGWVAYQIFEKKKKRKQCISILQNNPVLKTIVTTIKKNKAQGTAIQYDDDSGSGEEGKYDKEDKIDRKSGHSTSENILPELEMGELAEKLPYAKSKGSFAKICKWISDNKMWFKDLTLPKEIFVSSPEKLKLIRREFLKKRVGPYIVQITGELFTKFEAYMIIEKKGLVKGNTQVNAEAIEDLDITKNYLNGGKKDLNATQLSILHSASLNTSHIKRTGNVARVYGPKLNSMKDDSSSFRVDA